MTTELEQELIRIARTCRLVGPDTFAFADGPEVNANERIQDYAPEDVMPGVAPLVQVLTQSIYFQCYVRPFEGRIFQMNGGEAQLDDPSDELLQQLQAANHGQLRWEPGWEIYHFGKDGEVTVKKGEVHRILVPGEFALDAGPGIFPEEGDQVRMHVFADSLRLQRGYYYALGEEVGDEFDNFSKLRFYFNITPEDAPTLVETFTRSFNQYQVPFLFKCPLIPGGYNRTDTAVLYFSHRFFDIVAQIMTVLAEDTLSHLQPEVPLFSRLVWPGIGFAEDPGYGKSFGMDRCRLVAEGIAAAWQITDTPTDEQFVDCIRDSFNEADISLTTPWLNAGSTHDYDFSSDVAAVARPRTSNSPLSGDGSDTTDSDSPEPRDRFLGAAERIASRLCRDAIWSGDACNWMAWTTTLTTNGWTPAWTALGPAEEEPLVGVNIHRGTAGIARFLTRLETIATDRIRRRTLLGIINQILLQPIPDVPIGFYGGAAGVYDTLIEAGRLLEDQSLIDRGVSGLARLAEVEPDVTMLDLTHGSAGLIPVLLQRATEFNRDDFLEAAVRHGQHLLTTAVQSDEGQSWDTMPERVPKHITGYSHGTSGIVFSLLKLHAATGESPYLEAAREGMRYERNQFHEHSRNWIDYRSYDPAVDTEVKCLTAWCHGAPGIALTRLAAHKLVPDDTEVRADLDAALVTTASDLLAAGNPVARDWCLCHGLSGNSDILLSAAETLGDDSFRTTAEAVGDRGLQSIQRDHYPWPCNIGAEGEHPGLMLGLAGVGDFYLRLFDSKATPTILIPGDLK